MLIDWLVTAVVCVELLLETSTITTTINAITSATATAIAQPLPPLLSLGGG
jgi:hypothetical protein